MNLQKIPMKLHTGLQKEKVPLTHNIIYNLIENTRKFFNVIDI